MKNDPRCPFYEVCFVPAALKGTGIAILGKYCRESFECCAYYRRFRLAAASPVAAGERS